MAKNLLVCHILHDKNKEVASVRTKIYKQDFTWNKRIWAIDHSAIITDKKGISHFYVDVNETTGVLRFDKSYIDKCKECGKQIGIDASNARDLLKRKTINAIWGIDNSYVMLLLLMGIVLVAMVGALFFVIGELNKTNNTLQKYLPPPTPKGTTVTNFIIPMVINN